MQAFPAADGRTLYMFTYSDADPSRPSFAELLDTYCRLLPTYQVGCVLFVYMARGPGYLVRGKLRSMPCHVATCALSCRSMPA